MTEKLIVSLAGFAAISVRETLCKNKTVVTGGNSKRKRYRQVIAPQKLVRAGEHHLRPSAARLQPRSGRSLQLYPHRWTCCDGLTTAQLYDICEHVIGALGGVGYYPKPGFVHVDPRCYETRWSGS